MADIITVVTSMVTASVGWVTSFLGAIMAQGNELLLLFAALPAVGIGIGFLRRLITID